MAKHNSNVTYQWCFLKKHVEGCTCQWFKFFLQFTSSYTIKNCFFIQVFPSKHSSWWRRLEDEYIRVTHTSSVDVFKTSSSRQIYSPYSYVFRRRLQDVFKTSWSRPLYLSWPYVFKTSSRRFKDVFKTSCKNVFKTSSRRLQDVLQRSLQDVFKTYHQVKLFLLTRFQNDFETYSKRFWDVLQRRLSIEGFA